VVGLKTELEYFRWLTKRPNHSRLCSRENKDRQPVQKRKLGLVKRIKKQIDKFGLTNEELGIINP
jgi:hypothetical protein